MSLAISIEEEENVGVFSLLPSPEQASTSQAFGGRNMPESSMGSKPGTLPPRQVFPPLVSDGQHLGVRANTAFYKMLTHLEEEARMVLPNVVSTQPSLCTDGGELWVDKYRPHKFTDLLAMDSAHVEVLQWATQWRRHIEGGNHREDLNGKRRRLQGSSHDAEAIPFERSILLIHGPPGLGKTTLAHIVAQVGSFAPLEVNASDERSGDVVLERIKAALGSDSLDLQGFGRPHMIIIDEIDGAAAGGGEKGLITFLVKLANSTTSYGKGKGNSERKATNLDDDHDGGEEEEVRKEGLNGTTPGRRGRPALARPIICICNDLFASALRPLRQAHAGVRVVSMRRPTAAAIRQRLAEVCEKEGLRLEGKALLELIDMMDGDVRACLHALQFIARSSSLPGSRGKRPLNVADLREALRTAVRDVGRSTADVYESIFYADPLYKHHHHSVRGEVRSLQQAVLDTIIAHGEYERLATGAFELYPQCKFFDDTQLSRVNKGLEWLSFLDSCSTATLADERIAAYQPYTLLKFHHLFSSTTRPSFKFPRGDYEQHMVMRGMQEILRSYQTGLQQLHRKPFDQHYLLCERIPIVLRLIRPPVFRTTNLQLLRAEERTQLRKLVDLMLSEGLNYRQVRNEDGTYAFILEPPLETLASFPLARDMGDVEGSSRPKCTSSTAMVGRNSNLNGIRQMIASEVELERIRRCGRGRSEPESAPSILGRRAELQKAYADMIRMKGQTGGNKGGGSITGNTRSVTKKDFFGRPIPPSAHDVTVGDQDRDQSSEERPMAGRQFQPVRDRVWFRFNEGFTNAVRRPMRIRDLFTNLDKT